MHIHRHRHTHAHITSHHIRSDHTTSQQICMIYISNIWNSDDLSKSTLHNLYMYIRYHTISHLHPAVLRFIPSQKTNSRQAADFQMEKQLISRGEQPRFGGFPLDGDHSLMVNIWEDPVNSWMRSSIAGWFHRKSNILERMRTGGSPMTKRTPPFGIYWDRKLINCKQKKHKHGEHV